jgi:hypothetical protein
MLLLKNKYTKWYFQIITRARKRDLLEIKNTEVHHIIPRSLGGDNKKLNLVRLTLREHYLCHLLLTKMLMGESKYKMAWALMLLTSKRKITNSRQFANARRILSESAIGRPKTTEWRKKMSERMSGSGNPNYKLNKIRDTRTPVQKKYDGVAKMTKTKREQAKNKQLPIQQDAALRERIRSKALGRPQTEQQKRLASNANSLWYIVETPGKEQIKVFNLRRFCIENKLDRSNLYSTYTGRTKQHKGYRLLQYIDV